MVKALILFKKLWEKIFKETGDLSPNETFEDQLKQIIYN